MFTGSMIMKLFSFNLGRYAGEPAYDMDESQDILKKADKKEEAEHPDEVSSSLSHDIGFYHTIRHGLIFVIGPLRLLGLDLLNYFSRPWVIVLVIGKFCWDFLGTTWKAYWDNDCIVRERWLDF